MERLPEPIARALDPASRGGDVYPPPPPATKATTPRTGSIYYVQAGRHLKIGYTTSIPGRMKELQTGSPHLLSLLAAEHGKTKADERALHERFKEYRRQGEWFQFKGALLEHVYALIRSGARPLLFQETR